MRLHPFRALLPPPELAPRVAAVPYDVVNRAEAAELAGGNSYSFLHIGRSDIDLPESMDPHDPRIYAKAREALDRFKADGILLREPQPSLYLYRQEMEAFRNPLMVGFYVISMVVVGSHLWHGVSSAFQSLGVDQPRWTPRIMIAGKVMAVLIAVGFIAIALWAHFLGARS